MCFVIDANCLSKFFNSRHGDFYSCSSLREWLTSGKAKIIFGGSKYEQEAFIRPNYRVIFDELRKIGKAHRLDYDEVDKKEREISLIESSPKLDDPHIISIVVLSNCKILYTDDVDLMRFIKDKRFYGKRQKSALIFRDNSDCALLHEKNLSKTCGPYRILNKKERVAVSNLFI